LRELVLEAKKENLKYVFEFVTNELAPYVEDKKLLRKFKLCMEEVFLNISEYAYHPETGPAKITLCVVEDEGTPKVRISFVDHGFPFDPLEVKPPELDAELEDRQVGGLGIFLVRTTMDGVTYEYRNGENVLTMEKKLK
jgi:anti-sigma regulatory factor (Ser/Thr protein kinase)